MEFDLFTSAYMDKYLKHENKTFFKFQNFKIFRKISKKKLCLLQLKKKFQLHNSVKIALENVGF